MLIVRVAAACLAIALSSSDAFPESPQIVAVSGRDQLALHDLATGAELARFDALGGSSDLVALGSGVALSNHTAGNEVMLIDLKRRAEIGRLPSSSLGGVRPVHMYLSPSIEERQYVVILNDGSERSTPKGERPKDSTLLLIDAVQSSSTFLKPVGEARLGIGHHKVGFSMKRPRLAVSNISVATVSLQYSATSSVIADRCSFGSRLARTGHKFKIEVARPYKLSKSSRRPGSQLAFGLAGRMTSLRGV